MPVRVKKIQTRDRGLTKQGSFWHGGKPGTPFGHKKTTRGASG